MPVYAYNEEVDREAVWAACGYHPHPGQQPVHASHARHKVLCCGRRWGKSLSAAMDIFPDLLMPNQEWWIVGPQYVLGEREFRQVHNACKKMRIGDSTLASMKGFREVYNLQSGDMRIHFPWNTTIRVVSAERTSSLQGEGLAGVIMSEAAEHVERTWLQYVRPALSDKGGRSIWASTPKGFNFFYDAWMRGADPDEDEWSSWASPTWENTAVFSGRDDPEILQAERELSQMLFDQEYGAKFTAYEGLIYPEFDADIHVTPITYQPHFKNFWGIDFGYSVPWVCLDIMVDPMDNVYIWREYQQKFGSTMDHAMALQNRDNPDGFHMDAAFADPAGPGDISTLNKLIGSVWGMPREVTVEEGYEAVKSKLKPQPGPFDLMSLRMILPEYAPKAAGMPKLFIDPSCRDLIRQMTTLRCIEEARSGKLDPKQGQVKKDDHGPDALRYALSCIFVLGYGNSLKSAYAPKAQAAAGFFARGSQETQTPRLGVGNVFNLDRGPAPWRS